MQTESVLIITDSCTPSPALTESGVHQDPGQELRVRPA